MIQSLIPSKFASTEIWISLSSISIINLHFSLIDAMSGTLEQVVDETLNSNFRKLEEKFDSQHEIETDFTAVQGMGNLSYNHSLIYDYYNYTC